MDEVGKCCVPGCERPLHLGTTARGLCPICYQQARRLVNLERTTWRELEDMGLAKEIARKHRTVAETPFALAFLQGKRKQKEDNDNAR